MSLYVQTIEAFRQAFPDQGAPVLCRAPGRTNLIGEHVDYNGLPVLPMAIQKEIRIAAAPASSGRIRLRNRDAAFAPAEFSNGAEIPPSAPGAWENYCKAALQGLNRYFSIEEFPGADLLVDGDIPVASGVSSSSALVVASALAYLSVLGKPFGEGFSKLDLATLLAEAEQYVGTRGGGMDQAIILLGQKDRACKIDFFPLRAEAVPLFSGHAIILCNSMVKAEKTGNALMRYNQGPLMCRLIRRLVEHQAKQMFDEEVEIARLAELWYGPLCLTHSEVADLFEATFPKTHTSLSAAAAVLGMQAEDVRDDILAGLDEPPGGYPLQSRARHQLTEFRRVEAARDCALAGDAAAFGALMNASHESCANDYGVSCAELDALVAVARGCGSIGSRLTGAGFGGCTVNLVPVHGIEAFHAGVTQGYYRDFLHREPALEAILVVEAVDGAGVIS